MFICNLGITLLLNCTLLFYLLCARASFLFPVRWTYLIVTVPLWSSPVQATCGDGHGCSLKFLPRPAAAIILAIALLVSVVLLIILIRSLRVFQCGSTRDRHVTTATTTWSPFINEDHHINTHFLITKSITLIIHHQHQHPVGDGGFEYFSG